MSRTGTPLAHYLRARRALVQPEDVGILGSTPRRVAGLRRDEVARLAGVSQEYYLRLEQGRDRQPSHQVLLALARALQLDAAATEYMLRLAQIQAGAIPPADPPGVTAAVTASLHKLLDRMSNTPAYIQDGNQDVLMVNPLARALAPGVLEPGVNLPLTLFDDAVRRVDPDWTATAERTVATLRFDSDPEDPRLHEVVGLLSMRSPEFRRLWARHEAHPHHVGPVDVLVPPFGAVTLTFQRLTVPGARGTALIVFHAEAGTVAEEAIAHLRDIVETDEEDALLRASS